MTLNSSFFSGPQLPTVEKGGGEKLSDLPGKELLGSFLVRSGKFYSSLSVWVFVEEREADIVEKKRL